MKKLLLKFIIGSLLISAAFFLNEDVFAGGSFYLSPASKTVPQGTTFSVAVRISSTDPINVVQANLSYPSDKLDFVGINTSGSTFDMQAENVGGGGQVKIARGLAGTVTGDKLVATVTFRAKQSSGSTSISFTAGSEAVNPDGAVVVSATSGGTYSFSPAPPPPPPPAPPDTTAPKISGVKVKGTSHKGATVEWKTEEPASSIIEYGLNNKYGLSSQSTDLVKDHKVTFSSELLILGETYHFKVKSADAAGNMATGSDATFKTKGFTVKIKVLDKKGSPVKNATVTLFSDPTTTKTREDGIASFQDVSSGKHMVTVEYQGNMQSKTIQIKDATDEELKTGKIAAKNFQISILATSLLQSSILPWLLTLLLASVIIILLVSGMIWWKKNKPAISSDQYNPNK